MGNKGIIITLGALIVLLVVLVGVNKATEYVDAERTVAYVSEEKTGAIDPETLELSVPHEEKDNIEEAQRQLDEAKRLLAEEEATLLAEIDERELRLEKIRETRMSFSQAPDQVE